MPLGIQRMLRDSEGEFLDHLVKGNEQLDKAVLGFLHLDIKLRKAYLGYINTIKNVGENDFFWKFYHIAKYYDDCLDGKYGNVDGPYPECRDYVLEKISKSENVPDKQSVPQLISSKIKRAIIYLILAGSIYPCVSPDASTENQQTTIEEFDSKE